MAFIQFIKESHQERSIKGIFDQKLNKVKRWFFRTDSKWTIVCYDFFPSYEIYRKHSEITDKFKYSFS